MDYCRTLQQEKDRILQKLISLNTEIAKYPEGTLTTNKNGDYHKYYVLKNGKRKYISKDDNKLIEELAKKKYLMAEVKDLQNEINAINAYLNNYQEERYTKKLISKEDGVSEILKPLIMSKEQQLLKWETEEYPSFSGFPQGLIHQGPFGKKYRSKTEANIAFLLVKHHVPQRYEWERMINGTLYPIDFTTKHPKDGRLIFWEHFGRMDDASYCMKIGTKLRDFESAGIFPGINLIMTFESKRFPMNINQLEEIVEAWYQ